MVWSHLSVAQRLASGIHSLANSTSAFSVTQAAYRFLNNNRIKLPALMEPVLEAARQAVPRDCDDYLLVIHDWSELLFRRHHDKEDRIRLSADYPEGYELQTALLVSDRDGAPLAPAVLSLIAADGVHCTRCGMVRPALSKLDELGPTARFVERQKLGKTLVHIADAEADSVGLYRRWQQDRHLFLVRADNRIVEDAGQEQRCASVQQKLRDCGQFRKTRDVQFRGKSAEQWVAEMPIRLTRPAYSNRVGQPRRRVAGTALSLRLVIAEVRALDGQVLANWFLLSNVPDSVPASTLALWYYWRWRIESYFKLLKSAGMELEQWRQTTAAAIARRLLVASMACIVVWQLARDSRAQAEEARQLLVRLSGRQMGYGKRFTEPALLAGLWVLLAMLAALETYSLEQLANLAEFILPQSRDGPTS
jgi:hypothetical protein